MSFVQCALAGDALQLAAATYIKKRPRASPAAVSSPAAALAPLPAGGLLDRDEINPVLNGTLPGE